MPDNRKLSVLSQMANANTNLRNSPMRYMDHSSFLAGTPLEYGEKYRSHEPKYKRSNYDAWGLVDPDRPEEVYLAEWDLKNPENLKTLAHEGNHSKQVIARKNKHLPDLSHNIIDSVKYLMESNPQFLRDYLGHDSDKRQFQDIDVESMKELLSQDEIGSRLQAIEAMSPKGQMIEKSRYANDLFGSGEEVDKYLRAMVPEGFINSRSADSFRPAKPESKPWPGPLELLRGMIQK